MRDQAEALRLKMMKQQGELGRAIAVVSGKGGVGKSNFTMNFAMTLAQKEKSCHCRHGYWDGKYPCLNWEKCFL